MSRAVSRRIAESLSDSILAGEMRPGDRIRQEELAESFGTSRVPIREALYMLQSESLVRLVSNTGAWVAELTQAECVEAYQVRELVEPLILEKSLRRLPKSVDSELERLADEIDQTENLTRFLKLDRDFHWLTYSGCEPGFLFDTVRKLWNITQYYRSAFVKLQGSHGREVIHHEHALIIDAVRRRDSSDAGRLMALHIRRTRLSLAEHPELFDIDSRV
ncbi:GntR family transcriptional regulator [Okibacterium endophyticum]